MSNVNKIVGGITPKGTIFIREIGEKGNLLRKRVVKGEMQYDAKMSDKKTNKCSQVLVTDWNKKGEQTLQLMPKNFGAIKGFFLKMLGTDLIKSSDGKFLTRPETIPILRTNKPDVLYDGYVRMIYDKTGYSDMGINREMANLKTQLNVREHSRKLFSESTVRRSFPQDK